MKKSIVAMLSITALATVANAETLHTGTDFEGTTGTNLFWATHNDSGTQTGETFYWYATNYVEQSSVDQSLGVYTNYETAVEGNARYLALDTEGNRVYRTIASRDNFTVAPQPQAVNGTIYFDALVQFTLNEDDAPTRQEGDKLAVWLKGGENETNLVVTAGYLSGGEVTPTNYVVQTTDQIEPGNWYRLTIDAIPLISAGPDQGYFGFRVRIDGNYVTTATDIKGSVQDVIDGWAEKATGDVGNAALITDEAGLFPSLVKGGSGVIGCDTLACVGFEGTGAIDSLLFTDEDPIASVVPDVPGFVVNGETNTYENVADFIAAFKAGQTLALPEGWSFNGGVIGPDGGEPYATVPTYYNVDATTGAISLNETVVRPVFGTTEGTGTDPDTEPITVDETNGIIKLNVTNGKAGLYYGVRKYTALGGASSDSWNPTAQATDGNVILEVAKPANETAAFYQVIVNDVVPAATPTPESAGE